MLLTFRVILLVYNNCEIKIINKSLFALKFNALLLLSGSNANKFKKLLLLIFLIKLFTFILNFHKCNFFKLIYFILY